MNGPDRYRTVRGQPSAPGQAELGSLEGVDPVTGLPLLIYEFEGEPLAQPGDLDSDNIPRILWSGSVEGGGRLVVAQTPGWQRLAEDSAPLTPALLLDAARALRDAARIGLAHGDLRPERLLLAGDNLLLEGFGVPWHPGTGRYCAPEVEEAGTPAGDVWSLAKVVEQLGLTVDDETVSAVLEQCSASDPNERPSAEELYLALESLVSQQDASEEERTGSSDGAKEAPAAAGTPSQENRAAADRVPDSTRASAEEARGSERQPPGSRAEGGGRTTTEGQPGAGSKEGATSRTAHAGEPREEPGDPLEEPGEKRRRLILLGALMAAVVILALLAIYGPRGGDPPVAATLEDTVYVVQVEVSPTDLAPVTIHLISSPAGSNLSRGESLGTAPRHLALDREGTWAFQGSLGDRRSEVVEIDVPQERTVSFVIPP